MRGRCVLGPRNFRYCMYTVFPSYSILYTNSVCINRKTLFASFWPQILQVEGRSSCFMELDRSVIYEHAVARVIDWACV